jgi:cytochrome c oxidase accessory protein FixG
MSEQDADKESYRDHIATVDEKGKRIWIYPKKPVGPYYNKRKILSYFLLALLFAGPHIRIGGEPLLLLDVIDRKFIIFGQIFWPQDMYLFALGLVTFVVFVILFTVVFGRLFCGWVCPQTIFMEMVFRRIEYAIEGDANHQKRLNREPWNGRKIRLKLTKHLIFWGISFLIANTFLAYLVGSERLWMIVTDPPAEHIVGLISIVVFTTVFYLVFSQMREQVCTTVCPYGRLQGVLLDRKSMVVAYDHVRGEKRSKFKKGEVRNDAGKGDCIDCNQCVVVCPTGIDIRNGTQLECVNCTACMDACDTVMDRVGLPKKLIRYASDEGIAEKKEWSWTPRVLAYTGVLTALVILLTALTISRDDVQTKFLRTRGMIYQDMGDGTYSNLFDLYMLNKTNNDMELHVEILEGQASIEVIGNGLKLPARSEVSGKLMVRMQNEVVKGRKTPFKLGLYNQDNELIEEIDSNFMGPAL